MHLCPAGWSSFEGQASCHPCDKGKYSKSRSVCLTVLRDGSRINPKASVTCRACPSGYNMPVTGSAICNDLNYIKECSSDSTSTTQATAHNITHVNHAQTVLGAAALQQSGALCLLSLVGGKSPHLSATETRPTNRPRRLWNACTNRPALANPIGPFGKDSTTKIRKIWPWSVQLTIHQHSLAPLS